MQVAQNELGKDYSIFAPTLTDGKYIIPIKSVLENLLSRIDTGRNVSQLSQWFHNSLIHTFVRICEELRSEKGIEKIVLSGGVFQNRLLFEGLLAGLAQKGFSTFTHQQVPCNDGGLALGQVAIGLKYLQK